MNYSRLFSQLIKPFFTLLFLLFLSFNWAIAQYEDQTECPFFRVSSEDTSGVAFSLLATDIEATISGVIANVIIEQTYYNAGETDIDATYVFPMSTNAAVYGMEMIIEDRLVKAVIKRKEEAQTIFDNANEAGQTATLLEQERPNVFTMKLANISAKDTIKVRMVYTELLTPKNGVYQWVFPNIVGPRFTTNGEAWVYQANRDRIALSETALNIDLKINAGMPLEAEVKSHEVDFEYEGNSAKAALRTRPGADFIVDYTLDDNQIETGLLLYEEEEENFFLSMIQPTKPDVPYVSPPREYIFIMDVSGSMRGAPIEVSKQLIKNLLSDLNFNDKFNIVFFAGGSSVLAPSSIPVTEENIGNAIEMVERLQGGGGTRLLPAMERALAMGGTKDFARTFIILTDGYVSVEKETFQLIRKNLNEANFFSFGIGRNVNRYIIEGIAYVGEGEPFVVTDQIDAYNMANTFKEYIEKPVLTNIEATFNGIEVYDVEPLSIPDVFAERPVIIYGKYRKPAEGDLTLSGDYAGGKISSTFFFSDYLENAAENVALKYLWARKRIKLMSDYELGSNEGDGLSIEEEITQLGLKYSLVTEFTSFVAVDTIVTVPPDEEEEEDNNDTTVDTDELYSSTGKEDRSIIKISGNVLKSDRVLSLHLENLRSFEHKNLSLVITNISGVILKRLELNPLELENRINIDLGHLPAGLYFISLHSKAEVLDTEKFVIK